MRERASASWISGVPLQIKICANLGLTKIGARVKTRRLKRKKMTFSFPLL